jgi:23S rRNA (guanosine2251-2'-O)-methyltransferase
MAPRGRPPARSGKPSGGGRGRPAPRSSGSRTSGARSAGNRSAGGRGSQGRGDAPRTGSGSKEKSLGGDQVEGRQAVRELLIAGRRKTREIWIAADIDPSDVIDDIRELANDSRVQVLDVARKRIEQTARSEAPQGVIAFANALPESDFEELLKTKNGVKPFLVALDGVTDPGNLGALLRCCDGAGVTGVILPKHRSVHVTPTAAKAAAGAIEHINIAVVGGLPNAMAAMKKAGVWTVGLDDDADRSLFDIGSFATDPVCLVLGAEGKGISRLVRERCDAVVSIPMEGQLSSLNVSAAGALATYEVLRARQGR